MSVEVRALPMAQLQEAAATLMLHAARRVSTTEITVALVNLGVADWPEAATALRRIIEEAHVGVEVRGNPMAFFDDPALPEEVRYR